MNFNTLLLRLGFNPDNFVNENREIIQTPDGFIYEVRQQIKNRTCPKCGSIHCTIHDHDIVEINCNETSQFRDTLRIIKTRLKCRDCGATFTPDIDGLDCYSKTSFQTVRMLTSEFARTVTFTEIARRYGLSTARVLQIFDERIPFVPRKSLPAILCIDEISFDSEFNQKYCCVLYDHEKREVVDIIKNRQLPYLYEYFSSISEKERQYVRYFVSDMYDGYRNIHKKFFPSSLHIVDLFHVVKLLTTAVNSIRVDTMKTMNPKSAEYRFMKGHWKLFLCRTENIPDRYYTPRGQGNSIHYTDMVFNCTRCSQDLLTAHNILQDLFHYGLNDTFQKSLAFVEYIADRLRTSGNVKLESVGDSYFKWRYEIASGLARTQSGRRFSNGVAESVNNHLKTIIKCGYGYHNFERFRKRALLICTYKKI